MEEFDNIKVILALLAMLSFGFNIYQYLKSIGKFKVRIGVGHASNLVGVGTYLAGHVTISNIGDKPMYFSGLKINTKDDFYYPGNTFEGGTKVEPHSSITGYIPIGHLIGNGAIELIVLDGIWREYKVPKSMFAKALSELEIEKDRLESLGFSVDPVSQYNA